MTLREELQQMFAQRAASDPLLSEAVRAGRGGSSTLGI